MQQPRIVQVDYHEFQAALRRAGDLGRRVDAPDRDRWASWVKTHGVKEAAFKSIGGSKFEGLIPVIIDDSEPWGGYYLYSSDEEACLKWQSGN